MNDKFSDELLSAYHDGEAMPSQRGEVERRLKASADARRELAEFQQLSSLLQEQPHEPAPAEFRAAVMQAAERQILLAGREMASHRRSRNGWSSAVSTLVASAALLLMAVLMFEPPGAPTDPRLNGPIAMTNPSEAVNESLEEQAVAHAGKAMTVDALMDANSDRQQYKQNKRFADSEDADSLPVRGLLRQELVTKSATTASRVAPRGGFGGARNGTLDQIKPVQADRPVSFAKEKEEAERSVRRDSIANSNRRPSADDEAQLQFGANLKQAEIGQLIEGLDVSDESVAVVELTVVDRQAGLEAVQLLLQRNAIQFKPAPKLQAGSKFAAPAKPAASDRLVAVYIEATSQQLTSAFSQLLKDKRVRELRTETPVAAAQLERVLRLQSEWRMKKNLSLLDMLPKPRRFNATEKSDLDRRVRKNKEAKNRGTPAPKENDVANKPRFERDAGDKSKKPSGKPATADEVRSGKRESHNEYFSKAWLSVAEIVTLPANALKQPAPGKDAKKLDRKLAAAKSPATTKRAAGNRSFGYENVQRVNRPVRVLLILVTADPGPQGAAKSATPTSAPAKKKAVKKTPGDGAA